MYVAAMRSQKHLDPQQGVYPCQKRADSSLGLRVLQPALMPIEYFQAQEANARAEKPHRAASYLRRVYCQDTFRKSQTHLPRNRHLDRCSAVTSFPDPQV